MNQPGKAKGKQEQRNEFPRPRWRSVPYQVQLQ